MTIPDEVLDPDLLQASRRKPSKAKRITPDLHEEWAAVQGIPTYAYWLDWPDPEHFAFVRLILLKKVRGEYKVKIDKVLCRSKGYRPHWKVGNVLPFPREALCFTRKALERRIDTERRWHISRLTYEVNRLTMILMDTQSQLQWLGQALRTTNSCDPIRPAILKTIPLRKH